MTRVLPHRAGLPLPLAFGLGAPLGVRADVPAARPFPGALPLVDRHAELNARNAGGASVPLG